MKENYHCNDTQTISEESFHFPPRRQCWSKTVICILYNNLRTKQFPLTLALTRARKRYESAGTVKIHTLTQSITHNISLFLNGLIERKFIFIAKANIQNIFHLLELKWESRMFFSWIVKINQKLRTIENFGETGEVFSPTNFIEFHGKKSILLYTINSVERMLFSFSATIFIRCFYVYSVMYIVN